MNIITKQKIRELSEILYQEARVAFNTGNYGVAAELFFHAAEGQIIAGDKVRAAQFHFSAYFSKIQDERYLKDKPNLAYLGQCESILKEADLWELLIEHCRRINEQLLRTRHFEEAKDFYIKEMNAKKELFWRNKNYVIFILYWLWAVTSSYGESAGRLFISIIILSIIQSFMLHPAPIDLMETIRISTKDFPLNTLLDYWYFSFAMLFSWDWKFIQPTNFIGFVFILFRFLLSSLIVASFVNLLIRKLSSK